MIGLRSLLRAFSNPRGGLNGVADRVRYPAYKRYVGPPELYDALGRHQFELLQAWGLRPHHSLLDIGCGSLRAGRLFIRYLDPGNYFGIEPSREMVGQGIRCNLDEAIVKGKHPTFNHDADFNLSVFGRQFDFVLAHSIFTHAAQQQIGKCFREARKVMSGMSLFFANYNQGESDYVGMHWVYPSHVTYTATRISTLAGEAGLRCFDLAVPHPTLATWIVAQDPTRPAAQPEPSASFC